MSKIDNSKNPALKHVHTDKQGNDWFGYVNPMEVDAIRGIAAQRAERYVSMKISEDEFALCLDEAINAGKEGDFLKVGSIIYDLKHRQKFLCEENSVLDLAGIYFFLRDEDPKDLMDSYRLKKQKIWQDDFMCRAFFLRMGLSLSEKLRDIPAEDLFAFMEKTKANADRIYRHIPTPAER